MNKKIETILRKHGYKPELSDDLNKYERIVRKYLGKNRYEYFCELRDYSDAESHVFNFIGDDVDFFRLVLSGQIKTSAILLEGILKVLSSKFKDSYPTKVLELGGADGWTIEFLKGHFEGIQHGVVVDKFSAWTNSSEFVEIENVDYSEYEPTDKFNLILSILGCSVENIEGFIQCIVKSLADDGIAVFALRIWKLEQIAEILRLMEPLNLALDLELSTKILTGTEGFPVLCVQKGQTKINKNVLLYLDRKVIKNLDPIKVVRDYEATLFLEFIKDGKTIFSETKTYDDDSWGRLRLIEHNEVVYRITDNVYGNCGIEYPILNNDVEDAHSAQYRWDRKMSKNTA